MSHIYLLDLYDLIDQRMKDVSQELRPGIFDEAETQFQQGRCDILTEFKQFLAKGYNSKLPRRIRKKYTA